MPWITLPAPRNSKPLEEGVGHQVEHRRDVGPDARRREHEPELADRGVGQHLLDVGGADAHRRRKERRQRTDRGDDRGGLGSVAVQRGHATDHVDAGRHHRRGVDQRRNRRGAGHGVGQPDVQRNLRRLAAGADEEQDADTRQQRTARRSVAQHHVQLAEVQRAEVERDVEHADQEGQVADAVDDERLASRVGAGQPRPFVERLVVEEADQQVRTQPHAFPADEQHQQVAAQRQRQHHRHEQVEVGEEAGVVRLVRHVAHAVDVDQEADTGHDQGQHGRQRIETETPV